MMSKKFQMICVDKVRRVKGSSIQSVVCRWFLVKELRDGMKADGKVAFSCLPPSAGNGQREGRGIRVAIPQFTSHPFMC